MYPFTYCDPPTHRARPITTFIPGGRLFVFDSTLGLIIMIFLLIPFYMVRVFIDLALPFEGHYFFLFGDFDSMIFYILPIIFYSNHGEWGN